MPRENESVDPDGTPSVTSARWSVHGPSDADLFVGGHSHALAFLHAMEETRVPDGWTGAVVLDTERRSSSFLDDDYWALLARAAAGKAIAVVWNGNQHNAGFLLEPNPPIRVFEPGASTAGDAMWIPRRLLREYWTPSFAELKAALPLLTSVADVYLIGTPPPKTDELIRSVIQQDPYFVKQGAALGMDLAALAVTPAATRLAMWELLQEMLEQCAVEFGATFVAVPPDVTDDDGILLRRYSALDATHANTEYGARMWAEWASSMSKKGAVS